MNKIFKRIFSTAICTLIAGCMVFAVACNGDDNNGGLTYTGTALADGEVTVEYSASVATATGADGIKYSMSKGALPAGVTLSPEGALSGKPTKDGDFKFTVKAAAGSVSATADFTIKINKHLYDITYTGSMLGGAVLNEPYTATVATATSEGTAAVTYSTTDTLPAGLTLAADGTISGTPTAVTESAKSFTVTASADDAKPATATFSIMVTAEALPSLAFETKKLDDAQIGVAYTGSVATVTGVEGVKYSVYQGSALPSGLTLAENGSISGTPTGESATTEFTVLATAQGYSSTTAQFSLFVRPAKAIAKYTFEAENVDLTGFQGSGISGSAKGPEAIKELDRAEANCSGGYYISFTHRAGIAITFVINASEAGTAKLSLSLGTESSPIPVKSSSMTVAVNGSEIKYDTKKTTPMYNNRYIEFSVYEISKNVQLVEGENTIVLTIADNKLGNGAGALGFMIDALYLETDSYLTWTPHNTEITDK